MLFNSIEFAIFFPIVTILYFVFPLKVRGLMLLAASCWFYMAFIPKYIFILIFLIFLDYSLGLLIESARGGWRRVFFILSLCANIGMLGFFKYYNFFSANLTSLSHFIGWNYSIKSLNIILPIGLSFHTFQSMSYTIEVFRGRVKAERSLLYFALYVMFYPQLVAGPIERPYNLLHQLRKYQKFNQHLFVDGLRMIAVGLFKKIFIADRVAMLVNAVYSHPNNYSSLQLLIAIYFFAIQIYCDFSGYSSVALGAAKIMGIDLMVNFNRPYLAHSIADFWRRWHISLSSWFRDYVYIPLGGNRCSPARNYFNLIVVFLASGFWHGANWTFLFWGGLHGFFFIVYAATKTLRRHLTTMLGGQGNIVLKLVGIFLTFNIVSFAWIFFRASSLSEAIMIVKRIFTLTLSQPGSNFHPGMDAIQYGIAITLIVLLFFFEALEGYKSIWSTINAQPRLIRWGAYYCFGVIYVVMLLFNPVHTPQPFIYFQF